MWDQAWHTEKITRSRNMKNFVLFITLGFLASVKPVEGFFHRKKDPAPAGESYIKSHCPGRFPIGFTGSTGFSRSGGHRDNVRGGQSVSGVPGSRCGYVVLAIGTNGLPVNTRAMASSAPKAFLRAVEM